MRASKTSDARLLRVKRAKRPLRTSNRLIGAAATHSIKVESAIRGRIPNRLSIGDRIENSLFSFWSAERQRSATRVLGAGRASARNVTSIRVGCSAWLGIFLWLLEIPNCARPKVNAALIHQLENKPMSGRYVAARHRRIAELRVSDDLRALKSTAVRQNNRITLAGPNVVVDLLQITLRQLLGLPFLPRALNQAENYQHENDAQEYSPKDLHRRLSSRVSSPNVTDERT